MFVLFGIFEAFLVIAYSIVFASFCVFAFRTTTKCVIDVC